ncbi:MAG: hypothetical protein ACD_79C00740G0001, partial [uncultured bacterium]
MSKNAFIILILLIVSLVVISKVNSSRYSNSFKKESTKLLDFSIEAVKEIKLSNKDKQVILKEESLGKWLCQTNDGYKANGSVISSILLKLAELSSSQPVTSNPNNFSFFNLTEDMQTSILLNDKDSKLIARLDIGKERTNAASENLNAKPGLYVKTSNNMVYLISDKIDFSTENKDWLDKEILKIDEAEIQKISLLTTEPLLSLVPQKDNKEQKFKIEGIKECDKSKDWAVSQITSCLTDLKLAEVFSSNSAVVTGLTYKPLIKLETSKEIYNFSGCDKEGKFYLKITSELNPLNPEKDPAKLQEITNTINNENAKFSNWVYLLESWDAGNLNKTYADLAEAPDNKNTSDQSQQPNGQEASLPVTQQENPQA